MASESSQAGRPPVWAYVLAFALALPSIWLFGSLANLFEQIGADGFSPWLGALTAAGLLGALAFGLASRWPRHGVLWGLLLAAPTVLTMALWLGVNQARVDAALGFEVIGNLALLAALAALGGRWGQRRSWRSAPLTLTKDIGEGARPDPDKARPASATDPVPEALLTSLLIPVLVGLGCLSLLMVSGWGMLRAGNFQADTVVVALLLAGGCLWSAWRIPRAWNQRRVLLAKRPEALAIGATIRAWLPIVAVAHGALNLVVLAILALAVGVSAWFGALAGELTGFFLSAPLFLLFPFLLQGLDAWLRPTVSRDAKGWGPGSGYVQLLGFAALLLGVAGSMQIIEVRTLLRAEVVNAVRLSDLPAYSGRNAVLGVKDVVPARFTGVRSHGWSERVRGADKTTTVNYYRVYVTPLTDRDRAAPGADAVTLDDACVWLGVRHDDYAAGPESPARGLVEQVRRDHAQRLLETEPRWLREVIWQDVAGDDDAERYRRAIGGPSDAERGCQPTVFLAVAAPETLRADAWRQLALYFGLANLVPLLLLLGYGLWRLDRLGADEILLSPGRLDQPSRSREPHPLQRLFQCSDADREHYRAGRLSRRQQQRVRRQLWLAAGGTLAGMVLAGIWTFLALLLTGHVWTSPDDGWGARVATTVGLLLGLFFLIGLPFEQWRAQRITRQDLREGRVERLTGQVHRQLLRRNKSPNDYWIVVAGQRFDIAHDVYDALQDGAVYDIYQLPRSRRLLAILPSQIQIHPVPINCWSHKSKHEV